MSRSLLHRKFTPQETERMSVTESSMSMVPATCFFKFFGSFRSLFDLPNKKSCIWQCLPNLYLMQELSNSETWHPSKCHLSSTYFPSSCSYEPSGPTYPFLFIPLLFCFSPFIIHFPCSNRNDVSINKLSFPFLFFPLQFRLEAFLIGPCTAFSPNFLLSTLSVSVPLSRYAE